MTESNLGVKGLIWLIFHSPLRDCRAGGTQTWLEAVTDAEATEESAAH